MEFKPIKEMSITELQKSIRQLGKTANTRLASLKGGTKRYPDDLTQASHGYKYIEQLQFDGKRYIGTSSSGNIKFITAVGRGKNSAFTRQELEEELTNIRRFLNAKTSTVTGVKAVSYKAYQRYQSLGFKGNLLEYKEFAKIWHYELMQKVKDMFGSDEMNLLHIEYEDMTNEEFLSVLQKSGVLNQERPKLKDLKATFKKYNRNKKKRRNKV